MIGSRAVEIPQDALPVRDFLSDLWPSAPLGTVWEIRRWEGSVFYGDAPQVAPATAARSRLWVEDTGWIVAAALSEGGPQVHPHVRPDAAALLESVVAWSEEAAMDAGDGRVLLSVWDGDEAMRELAMARGYRETERFEVMRSMRATEVPPPALSAGYRLRPTRDEPADDEAIAVLLNAAFGRSSHYAEEHAGLARHASCFRRDTDLVAEATDGTLAAYAAVCWDRQNRLAIFEPVCTHPDHQRRGLARTLMLEGMRRAHELGAETIVVGTGDMDPANALYASLPFTEKAIGRLWELRLT